MRRLWLGLCTIVLASCGPQVADLSPATPTARSGPTPTIPATIVPGTIADERAVRATIEQFGTALARGDEVVALLVLSPSAQQIAATEDVYAVIDQAEQPRSIDVHAVQIKQTVALADCTIRYPDRAVPVTLQLVRLDGTWKIDAPVDP
jgi:hypothetical protein